MRYGVQALEDIPEFFVILENQRKSWAEEYALEVLEGQLRPKADEASVEAIFEKQPTFTKRIRSRLTPAELKKLQSHRSVCQGSWRRLCAMQVTRQG